MRPELERYHQIDLYLQDKLSVEEKAAFEAEMQKDATLFEEVEMQKMVNTVVLNAGYQDLKTEMSSDIQKLDKKAQVNKWKRGTALGIVGLMLISGGLWLAQPEEENGFQSKNTKVTVTDSSETSFSEVAKEEPLSVKEVATPNKKENNTAEKTVEPIEKVVEPIASEAKVAENPTSQEEQKVIKQKPVEIKETVQPVQETKKEEPIETKSAASPADLCKGVEMEITPMIGASCKEMPTGIIDLQNGISGGQLPYELMWVDLSGTSELQKDLAGGYYSLVVKDANACESEYQIFVPTEDCISTDAINPDLGEEWVFTNKKEKPFSIRIISLSGREIVREENITDKFFVWQGKDRNGASLPAGAYAWVVEYPNGKHNTGQITVIR